MIFCQGCSGEQDETEFLISDFKANCVDDFRRFYVTTKYSDFSHVCKFIFTLSHGQSAEECGFNINNNNKKKMVHNLQEMSLMPLRSVYDEIGKHGSIRSFSMENSLLSAC